MKRIMLKSLKLLYFFTCGWVMFSMNAHAYIDPSAVTYVIQAIAAVFIALGAVVTVFRHKIMAFFKRNSKKSAKREIHMKEDDNADGGEDKKN